MLQDVAKSVQKDDALEKDMKAFGSNKKDYQAFIVGMAFANGTYQNEQVSLYVPNSEISYYLGLKLYVITGKYLT